MLFSYMYMHIYNCILFVRVPVLLDRVFRIRVMTIFIGGGVLSAFHDVFRRPSEFCTDTVQVVSVCITAFNFQDENTSN